MWRMNPLRWMERFAAIWVGAMLVSTTWTLLFASPRITTQIDQASTAAVAGRPYDVTLWLVNASRRGKVRVDLTSTDGTVQFEPRSADVEPGGRSLVNVRGIAGVVGAQTVSVRLLAKSGWLNAASSATVDLPLSVWPSERFGHFAIISQQADWAAFRSTLQVGLAAPKGLECEALVSDGEDADFTGAAPALSIGHDNRGDRPRNRIAWSIGARGPFDSTDVYLFLKARGSASRPEWDALASRIAWTCGRN